MAKRIKIGDVIQILTSQGIAYAQFTHKHREFGSLLSVFEGFYPEVPTDFNSVVKSALQFQAFFPLQAAINGGLLSIVVNVPVASCNSKFPMFRTCVIGKHGERGPWWLWDGENENMLERELSDMERKYSLRDLISAPLLVERIEKGYRPEIHDV